MFSSLGLCWCFSCSKQMTHLLSHIPSSETLNQNFIFLGKVWLNKLHFISAFLKKSMPNISRTAVLNRNWKFNYLNIIQSMTLLFFPRRKGRRDFKLNRLYGSTRLDPLSWVFLYPRMPTFLVHHLVFQELSFRFYAVPVNLIKFWSPTVIQTQMLVFKLIYQLLL